MTTASDTKPIETKNHHSKLTIAGIYILAGLAGIFATKIFFGFLTAKGNPSKKAKPAAMLKVPPSVSRALPASTLPKSTPPALAPVQTKPVLNEGQFVLSGLFCAKEDSYALINNHIVKEGDTIEGAKVIKISEDGVSLDADGSKIFLPLKHN